jgi:hypothetical protein
LKQITVSKYSDTQPSLSPTASLVEILCSDITERVRIEDIRGQGVKIIPTIAVSGFLNLFMEKEKRFYYAYGTLRERDA